MNNLNLGLIKGRHPLPVDAYVIESEVKDFTQKALEPLVREGLTRNGLEPQEYIEGWGFSANSLTVNLYLTGLTIVSLIAVRTLNNWGYNVLVYGFNPNTQEYYPQGKFYCE